MKLAVALLTLTLLAACYVVAQPPPASPGSAPVMAGGPPPSGAGGIQIVAGTYGANCGQPRGNVTAHLAATCAGRADCGYKVDHQVIGDPANGCLKGYVAEWSCAGSPQVFRAEAAPEAGYGSVVQINCSGAGNAPPAPSPPPPPTPLVASPPPPPPPPPAHGHSRIHVVAGSYGQNCRAPRGNTTQHLQRSCEGQASCAYRVDHKVIGDPAYGCRKDYVAEWTCGASPEVFRADAAPEAGHGSVVQLTCPGRGGAAVVAIAPPPPPPPSPTGAPSRIHVIAGSYGQNCRAARGNTTPHLQQSCEGQVTCAYRVDHKVIGDPAYGCRKDYVAEWTCGQNPAVYQAGAGPEAGHGSVVKLACDGSVAPSR